MGIPSPAGLARKLFRSQAAAKPPKEDVGSIGLYGLSKAGKTVYLTMLFREASLDTQEPGRPKFKLQSRHLDTLREMHQYRELLEGRSEVGRPAFPTSTTVARLYRFDAIINRRYRYPFRTMDYKGEGLDVHHTSGTEETIEFLSSCHCLLFLYEPDEQMLDRQKEEADRAEPERRRRIELFTNMIANLRTEKTHRIKLDMPIGLVITKADKLEGFNFLEEQDTVLLKGPLANAKFTDANSFIERVLDQEHIRRHRPWHRQVRRILTGLTYFWDEILDSAPAFQVFFTSSTGGTATLINDKGAEEVIPPAQLLPKGVLTPFHWVVDMLETRRRVKRLNHVAWRWIAIPTGVLFLVMLALTHFALHRRLDKDLQTMAGPSGKVTSAEDYLPYYLYPELRARICASAGAARIGNDLRELNERSRGRLVDPPKGDDETSNAIRGRVEHDLESLKQIPSLAGTAVKVERQLGELEEALRAAIEKTIWDERQSNRFKDPKTGEDAARALGDYYALRADLGEQAAKWWRIAGEGNLRATAQGWLTEVFQLVQSTDLTARDRLSTKLTSLTELNQAHPELLSQAEAEKLAELGATWGRIETLTPTEAEALQGRYPLIAAVVNDRLAQAAAGAGGAAGGAGGGGGAGGAAPAGQDPGFVALAEYLRARESDLVDYYVEGLPRANRYLQETKGSADPAVQASRAVVTGWLGAVSHWQNDGLTVSIRAEELGVFQQYFLVLENGNTKAFDGPYNRGREVKALWRLGRPPGAASGIRLYFSTDGNPPAPDEQADELASPRTVELGLSALIAGEAVLVGRNRTPVRFALGTTEALPRLQLTE